MSKKALITGITGQDGPFMAQILLQEGYDVYGMARRVSHQDWGFLSEYGLDDITIVEGDLGDYSSLASVISDIEPDEIYNFGAQSHVHTSFSQPEMTANITGMGVLRLLDIIRKYTPTTKFYQASSSEMYGDAIHILSQDEHTPFGPRSPYASAKVFAHYTTKVYRESYNLFACAGILFNHESERRGERFVTRKITKFMSAYSKNKDMPPLKLGYLYAKRDWGYAKDYMKAVYQIMQHQSPDDFVIATGQSYSVKDFCDSVLSYLGIRYEWVGEGLDERCWDVDNNRVIIEIDSELYRPSEVPYLCGNSTKARNVLGWRPDTDFDGLVKIMVDYDVHSSLQTHNI